MPPQSNVVSSTSGAASAVCRCVVSSPQQQHSAASCSPQLQQQQKSCASREQQQRKSCAKQLRAPPRRACLLSSSPLPLFASLLSAPVFCSVPISLPPFSRALLCCSVPLRHAVGCPPHFGTGASFAVIRPRRGWRRKKEEKK